VRREGDYWNAAIESGLVAFNKNTTAES